MAECENELEDHQVGIPHHLMMKQIPIHLWMIAVRSEMRHLVGTNGKFRAEDHRILDGGERVVKAHEKTWTCRC